jgi:uncharacterized membrane protein YfcA
MTPEVLPGALAVAAVFLLAGWVKGVVGMGLPTVAMGLLGLLMAPVQAAALLVVPSLVTNVWQALAGPGLRPLVRRLGPMLAATCVGTALGIGLLASGQTRIAEAALGTVLLVYAVAALARPRLAVPPRVERWASPLAGLATGAITGATGVFVVPAVPYLGALGLGREALVQALGLSFTVSTLALGGALWAVGRFPAESATASLAAVLPAVAGMLAGQALRRRLDADAFRRGFLVALAAVGATMLARAVLRGLDPG